MKVLSFDELVSQPRAGVKNYPLSGVGDIQVHSLTAAESAQAGAMQDLNSEEVEAHIIKWVVRLIKGKRGY